MKRTLGILISTVAMTTPLVCVGCNQHSTKPIEPIEGTNITIDVAEARFDSNTRVASFKFNFDGEDGTIVNCSIPDGTTDNVSVKKYNVQVTDKSFTIDVIYVPSSNNETTVDFSLYFTYTINNQPYYQTINGLTGIVPDIPYVPIPGSVKFEQTEEFTTGVTPYIATFTGKWEGDMPDNNKFDSIEIFYCLASSTHSLSIYNSPSIDVTTNQFEVQVLWTDPDFYGLSIDKIKLNFLYHQHNIPGNCISEELTIKHQGEVKPEEGFLYLYNGTSVLYGQSGVSGGDTKDWFCYYFPNAKAKGRDVTSEAKFSFDCETTDEIKMTNNKLTWTDGLEPDMYWGNVTAQWTDADGNVYIVKSQEIVVNISDFVVTNPNPLAFDDTLTKYGFLKNGWICNLDGKEVAMRETNKVEITGDNYSVYSLFVWNDASNRIDLANQGQKDGTYENIRIKVSYTINNYTYVAESENIKITIQRTEE